MVTSVIYSKISNLEIPSRLWVALLWGLVLIPQIAGAGTWLIRATDTRPGSNSFVRISFRADEVTTSGVATIETAGWPHVRLPEEGWEYAGCRVGAAGRLTISSTSLLGTSGSERDICYFVARANSDAPSTTLSVGFSSVSCLDASSKPVNCDSQGGTMFIDGPPTIADRSFMLLPHGPPRGPARAVLEAFVPLDPSSSPPVQSLASPRPIRYFVGYRSPWSDLFHERANRAAVSLLSKMYATFGSISERNAALSLAGADHQVAAVFPEGRLPSPFVYPTRPVANAPFALYLRTGICEPYLTDHPDDREIEIEGNTIRVYLSEDNENLCGVPPPGEFEHVLNLPGLPGGEYAIRVVSRPEYPGDVVRERFALPLTVARGVPSVNTPQQVPGPAHAWLAALSLALALIGGLQAKRRRS